jgi:hypothetical protein
MTSAPGPGFTRRFAGSWLDDLAAIGAAWLDRRPIVSRLLILSVVVLAGPLLVTSASLLWCALVLLLLPRLPRLGGRVATVAGGLLAVAGATVIVLTPRTWSSFPQESGLGLALLCLGVFLGARRGPWLPWLVLGPVVAIILHSPFGASAFLFHSGAVVGLLVVIAASRVSAAPRTDGDAGAARARLAVALQARPWWTSVVVCAIAPTGAWPGNWFEPGVGAALVALLFHATWRAPTLFDRMSAWTVALAVPTLHGGLFWWLPSRMSGRQPFFGPGQGWGDFLLTPRLLIPLAIGLALGRRRPGRRGSPLDLVELVVAAIAPPLALLLLPGMPNVPPMYAVGLAHPVVWTTVCSLWLVPFHRLVATDVRARWILWGAAACGVLQLALTILVTMEDDTSVTLARGALAPVFAWLIAALLLLLARDVARVTRIPDENPVIADFGVPSRDASR